MKKIISTNKAPAAIGPYSQAITFGNLIFLSGQIGINPETGEIGSSIEEQTNQILKNIEQILKAANSSKEKILKTTIFLKSMEDFQTVNEIYGEFFKNNFPARSTVEVSRLPKDVLIEIEVIAYI